MREKYESLALADLKEIAKSRGIKGVSTMKKADVVEAMLAEDEKSKINPEKLSSDLDSGMEVGGILEVMPDGYGLSEVQIICQVKMMCMWHRARFVNSG